MITRRTSAGVQCFRNIAEAQYSNLRQTLIHAGYDVMPGQIEKNGYQERAVSSPIELFVAEKKFPSGVILNVAFSLQEFGELGPLGLMMTKTSFDSAKLTAAEHGVALAITVRFPKPTIGRALVLGFKDKNHHVTKKFSEDVYISNISYDGPLDSFALNLDSLVTRMNSALGIYEGSPMIVSGLHAHAALSAIGSVFTSPAFPAQTVYPERKQLIERVSDALSAQRNAVRNMLEFVRSEPTLQEIMGYVVTISH